MALDSTCLIDDIEPVRDYLDLDSSDAKETKLLEELANRVTDLFEKFCHRQFISATFTEQHDGSGNRFLFPKQHPITAITSIHDDTDWTFGAATLIDSADYAIHSGAQMIVLKSGYFTRDVQNIKIVYVAGYAVDAMPKDLVNALIEQVAHLYHKQKTKRVGITSRTLPDGSVVSYSTEDLLAEVKTVLMRYRKNFT